MTPAERRTVQVMINECCAGKDAEIKRLMAALREIAEARGTYSLNRLEHACNTIAEMREVACAALEGK